MKTYAVIIIMAVLSIFNENSYAWNDIVTHPHITQESIRASLLDSYLKNQLNITGGIDETVNNKLIRKWLEHGAKMEDDPICRATNHFHNPYNRGPNYWRDAGLSDSWWPYLALYCASGPYPTSDISSNLTWATGFTDQSGSLDANSLADNAWDWFDARNYFYIYLTGKDVPYNGNVVASDQDMRNTYLAMTLQAVGQVMHLLQDAAVPAHVRDDFSQGHLMFLPGYDSPKLWVGNDFERYVEQHNERWWFAGTTPVNSGFSDMRLTDLWDTDQLDFGYAPSGLGLSEYASLNFLSENSSFKPKFYFPRPEDCAIIRDAPPEYAGTLFARKYISSAGNHPGDRIQHLAVESYLKYFRDVLVDMITPGDFLIHRENDLYYFDANCHEEYASKLIPRAIGYSADLLDYFFRGRIDLVPDDGSNGSYVIENSGDEEMAGTFELYYDDHNDERKQTWSEELTIGPGQRSNSIFFTPPGDAKEQGKYILVFSGRMGHETNAVVGKLVEAHLPYMVVTYSGGDQDDQYQDRYFVWDVRQNRYAVIQNTDGNGISFPCGQDALLPWINGTTSVKKSPLYDVQRAGESEDFGCFIDCDPPYGACCDSSNSCSEVSSLSAGAVPLSNTYEHTNHYCYEGHDPCHYFITYDQSGTGTMEAKANDLFGSFKLDVQNDSGGGSTFIRTRKDESWHYFEDFNECPYYLQFFEEDNTYSIISFFGNLATDINIKFDYRYDVQSYQYESYIDSDSGDFNFWYTDNAIVQIILYQYCKASTHWPCYPDYDICDSDPPIVEERVVAVHAQVDPFEDAKVVDPTGLSRNAAFETAILNLISDFYAANGIDDKMALGGLGVDFRQ